MRYANSLHWLYTVPMFLLMGCADYVPTDPRPAEVEDTFQQLLDEAITASYDYIVGVSMSIQSPSLARPWSGASGFDSKEKENPLASDQPFRIASVTKTFVATAILRLHEMDSLSIDEPIATYISENHTNILKEGGYEPNKILIRHCLNHTSGLFDYAMGNNTFRDKARENPTKRWTRTEQLQGAMEWGEKYGEPGERYHYSDTGYILLGETIEHFFGGDLAQGLRTLLRFEQLNLSHTWLETLEDAPPGMADPVHRYLRGLDATRFDPSFDLYGGGGLMSTCPDLAKFMHALFNHTLFDKKATLDLMLTPPQYAATYDPAANERHKDYRYGLWEFEIYGNKAYMHGGLWGTLLIHIPAYNSSIAVNSARGWSARMAKKAILVLKHAHESGH